MRLRTKAILIPGSILVVASCLASYYVLHHVRTVRSLLETGIDREGRSLIVATSEALSITLPSRDYSLVEAYGKDLLRERKNVKSLALFDEDGEQIFSYPRNDRETNLDATMLSHLKRKRSILSTPAGENHRFMAPLTYAAIGGGKRTVYGFVKMELHRAYIDAAMQSLIQKFARLFAFVMLFTSGGLYLFFSRHVAKPIDALAQATRDFAEGRFDRSLCPRSNDEIGTLALSFNEMAETLGQTTTSVDNLNKEIADHNKAEQKLTHYATALERANENVKQFAYIVSHDLRVPLVNLKGFSAELRASTDTLKDIMSAAMPHLDPAQQRTATEALDSDVPEALDFIDSSAERMDSLVNALLRLSRLGHQEMNFERVVTSDLVRTILKPLSHQLQTAGARVCVEDLPTIVADRTAMEQIFANILANAVLYLQPGRPGKIEVWSERGETATTFSIRDNGRGIAQDDLPKVFAPFRRAGHQNKKGEGMGMAYVQALIQRHGGQIRCESEIDVGTTFTFSIPHRAESEDAAQKEPDKALVCAS